MGQSGIQVQNDVIPRGYEEMAQGGRAIGENQSPESRLPPPATVRVAPQNTHTVALTNVLTE